MQPDARDLSDPRARRDRTERRVRPASRDLSAWQDWLDHRVRGVRRVQPDRPEQTVTLGG